MLEVLIVSDYGDCWKVSGTQPIDKPVVDSNQTYLKASLKTLEIAKESLSSGKDVFISKNVTTNEVIPSDLIIIESEDRVETSRKIAIADITNLINQNVFGASILDSMDFIECSMKLMSVGIFITDENREDKYFEIIDAAQSMDEPEPLTDSSTFEDEQKYLEDKRKYDQAQKNLETLEKYLNAYDKLSKIRFVDNLLNKTRDDVKRAKTVEEINSAMVEYNEKIKDFFCNPKCST